MSDLDHDTARKIARAIGTSLFERRGYDAKAMAQANLAGRTHYVEDSTLRFFKSRINSCYAEFDGLILVILESAAGDMDNRTRIHRFVAFDLFGTVINDRNADHKSSAAAQKAFAEWRESFDVLAHYRQAMSEQADRLHRQATDLFTCARDLA